MTFGILCKPPEDEDYYWTPDQPEIIAGWHWWGSKGDRRMTLAQAQKYIDDYANSDRTTRWRYQIVRTS